MASTLSTDWKKDNITPPRDNAEVSQIMQEVGCGRRQAYTIMHRRRAEEMDVSSVSEGQRVAVMSTLINIPEARRDATNLLVELHAINVKIDMHDTVKTLWALQKQGFVRFRERNNPRSLYAISVTDKGYSAWNHRYPVTLEAETEVADVLTNVEPTLIEHEIAHERAKEVATAIAKARALQQKVNDLGAGKPTPVKDNLIERPWTKGELSGWPMFCNIRDRVLRAKKLNEAAKLLQEVGGYDDAVLMIMTETEFTDLENEVLTLLTMLGEIE